MAKKKPATNPSNPPPERTSRPSRKRPASAAAPFHDAVAEFERTLERAARPGGGEHYVLRLYVTGSTARSTAAIANIRTLCERFLSGRYDLEIIDVYQQPVLAQGDQIIAAPTLIKKLPFPLRKVVGDLSNLDRVLMGLDLRPRPAS